MRMQKSLTPFAICVKSQGFGVPKDAPKKRRGPPDNGVAALESNYVDWTV